MKKRQRKANSTGRASRRWTALTASVGVVVMAVALAMTFAPLAAAAFSPTGSTSKWTLVAAIAGLIAALAVWPAAWVISMQRAGRAERALMAVRRELSRAKRAAAEQVQPKDLLDAASLSALAQAKREGHDNAERVLRLFLETSPDEVDGLRDALETGDAEAAGLHAERLRAASQDVSSVELPVLLADVEALARAGDIGGMHAAANELGRAFDDLNLALKTLRARG